MSIHPHDVRELLGPQSTTTRVSDEQVERMVAVLNSCRAQHGSAEGTPPHGSAEGTPPPVDETSTGPDPDRPGELPTP
jgi:hypothetical protein